LESLNLLPIPLKTVREVSGKAEKKLLIKSSFVVFSCALTVRLVTWERLRILGREENVPFGILLAVGNPFL